MKKYVFALTLMFAVSAHSFEVTGDSFNGKWNIDSITVGKLESTINLSSPDTDIGQYGKVYLSYTLTSNPNIPNSGTWIGYGLSLIHISEPTRPY